MAQAIDMLRNDHESTPVARARALAYCCSVDAKLIEMATIDELQQPQQSEEQETELDAEYAAREKDRELATTLKVVRKNSKYRVLRFNTKTD
jgi:hypothetical protein